MIYICQEEDKKTNQKSIIIVFSGIKKALQSPITRNNILFFKKTWPNLLDIEV